ncbi:hypothetical protein AB4851_23105 [Burkholderia sp. 22PA0099]|uniref:hypothetical protein n=1 Tax=Burkholderia sp. 22PA0099 TaxID=3237372 RepID=UPI0039C00F3D
MTFSTNEQKQLIAASKAGRARIDDTVKQLRLDHPDHFHTEASLPLRRFHDQPLRGEPCQSFVQRVGARDSDRNPSA